MIAMVLSAGSPRARTATLVVLGRWLKIVVCPACGALVAREGIVAHERHHWGAAR